jgi:plasmid stability protein
MAQLLVRNLDSDVKQRLQHRALRHGRSMEEEIREILRAAADQIPEIPAGTGLGSRIASRFSGLALTDDLPEQRGQAAQPADLDTP